MSKTGRIIISNNNNNHNNLATYSSYTVNNNECAIPAYDVLYGSVGVIITLIRTMISPPQCNLSHHTFTV